MLYSSLRQTFNHPKMQVSSALCIYSINIHILNRGGEKNHTRTSKSTFHTTNGLLLPILSQCIIQWVLEICTMPPLYTRRSVKAISAGERATEEQMTSLETVLWANRPNWWRAQRSESLTPEGSEFQTRPQIPSEHDSQRPYQLWQGLQKQTSNQLLLCALHLACYALGHSSFNANHNKKRNVRGAVRSEKWILNELWCFAALFRIFHCF